LINYAHRMTLVWFVATLSLCLIPFQSGNAFAGPNTGDLNHTYPRPLKVESKISYGVRFDVITPKEPQTGLKYGEDSSWYSDELFIARSLETKEVLHAHASGDGDWTEFVESDLLSDDYVLVKEYSGGFTCCWIIYAFKTSPFKEILIGYSNYNFDVKIVSKNQIELHVFNDANPNTAYSPRFWKYNPQVFDLRTGKWLIEVPSTH
jgi:hypothetical protein